MLLLLLAVVIRSPYSGKLFGQRCLWKTVRDSITVTETNKKCRGGLDTTKKNKTEFISQKGAIQNVFYCSENKKKRKC